MGSGSSVPKNDPALVEKQQEIDELKRQLAEAQNFADELKKKSQTVNTDGLGTISENTTSPKIGASLSGPASKPNNRREEVSAETLKKQEMAMENYVPVVHPKTDEVKKLVQRAVDNNILFKGLRDEEKYQCVDAFYEIKLRSGECAIVQGDAGDKFFVVEHGVLDVLVAANPGADPIVYGQLTDGDSFGELALMYNKPRAATIKAAEDCSLWAINRSDYRNIHVNNKMQRKQVFEKYIAAVPDLSHLRPVEISRLADAVDEEEFEEGSAIIREGEAGDIFYIIEWGQVVYEKKDVGVVGTGSAGDYFGHKALLTEEKRAATVIAKTKVGCLTMARNDFVQLLGSLKDLKNRHSVDSHGEESGTKAQDAVVDGESKKYILDIKFEDLETKFKNRTGFAREIVLGQGAFGKVQIVKHTPTGKTYALKCLNKSQITENGLEAHVVDERKVMMMVDHPFLLKLHNSYWDEKYVYLLLELCLGGELFTILRKFNRFTEKATKFYSAIVLKAFEHLHERNIIYRDLKPENLMLDDKGYVKVVDFGLAKVVKDRTWTLCGTPDYLAPEIILSKGHDKAVDYWALGVLTYECMAGYVPFYAEDAMDVYSLILEGDIKFPSSFSKYSQDLVRKLLNPVNTKRLGNTKEGVNGIVKHRWFAGFDWDGLENRTLIPPIKVNVTSPEDTSNFDEYPVEHFDVPVSSWQPPFPHEVKGGITQP